MLIRERKLQPQTFVLFSLAVVPVFFLPSTFDVFNIPKGLLLFPISIAAITNLLLGRDANLKFSRTSKLFIVLPIGILATSLNTDTSNSRMIFGGAGRGNGLIYYSAIFLTAFVASSTLFIKNYKIGRKFLVALGIPLLINIGYGLIQFLGFDPVSWNNLINPVIGTVGNPNFSASILASGTIFGIYLTKVLRNHWRYFWLGVAIVAFGLSVLTNSIQGPMIAAAGVLIYLVSEAYKRSKKLGIFLIVSSVFSFIIIFSAFLGLIGQRLVQPTLLLRLQYWKIAVKSIMDNPFFGTGPDSYLEAFFRYRTLELVREYSLDLRSDAAHSVLLNFGVNFGLLNGLIYLVLIVMITRNAIKCLFQKESVLETSHFQIASLLWLVLVFQSFLSIEQIGLSTIQWILGGFLLNQGFLSDVVENKSGSESRKKFIQGEKNLGRRSGFISEFRGELSLLAMLLVAIPLIPILKEENQLAYLRFYKPNSSTSSSQVEEISQKYSFYTREEYARSIHLYNFFTLAGRPEDAKEVLENTISAEPQSMDAYEQLARMMKFEKNFSAEIKIREKIRSLSPNNARNLVSLMDAYLTNKNDFEALNLAQNLEQDFAGLEYAESATAVISLLKKT